MIGPKPPTGWNNHGIRRETWPYGSFVSHVWSSPHPIFTDCWQSPWPADGAGGRVEKETRGYRLYAALREAAWQGINTNSYPALWADLTPNEREKWEAFVKELMGL